MADTKYSKYILTDLKLPDLKQKSLAQYAKRATRILRLDNDVIKGAFYVMCVWYLKGSNKATTEAHSHDFDEVIAFFGSNPQDPHDLGGEIELWLDNEKHIIKKSYLVFVPRGLKHCPLRAKRVDRPIFHFTIGTGGTYRKKELS
jgi:quercetin dioxygenase-like cupin family protein